MPHIRKIIFNGLNRRNYRATAQVAGVMLAAPTFMLWSPTILGKASSSSETVFVGMIVTMVLAWMVSVTSAFTKQRAQDKIGIWIGFSAVVVAAMVYQLADMNFLAVSIALTALGWFLVARSFARFVTRDRALGTLNRVHEKANGVEAALPGMPKGGLFDRTFNEWYIGK